jgi:hypothetical protein
MSHAYKAEDGSIRDYSDEREESMIDWKIELRDKFLGRLSCDEFLDMFDFIEKTLQQQHNEFIAMLDKIESCTKDSRNIGFINTMIKEFKVGE